MLRASSQIGGAENAAPHQILTEALVAAAGADRLWVVFHEENLLLGPREAQVKKAGLVGQRQAAENRIGVITLISPALSGGRFGAAETNRPTSLLVWPAGRIPVRPRDPPASPGCEPG